MTEPAPIYTTPPPHPDALPHEAVTAAPSPLPDVLRVYFEREREATIMKLRMLDRVLGRRQTIPERVR